ncbi:MULTISPECIES: metal-dependent transcriptional regulator [Roseivirga]|uniref:Transcriptional regulator MntR n=1 Tax=Roseivirga thermotolerans TaxID=1758176 RepID=A0ABQ3I886_9BACT|nr:MULTISPECIES: metal-dependent transcriptional regulator [Roseivirga]MEC7755587.1 metal-dependent transcriptional regulator [Bacteroidota bacterium]GHE71482.1 iron-dependent repressor [Roseivirga thermotolerans]
MSNFNYVYSLSEENYIKAIYHLSNHGQESVNTNAIAIEMNTTPASVSDMIRKLSKKKVVDYQKYRGVHISEKGKEIALKIIRKHRLWEVFLVEKLNFHWDEVHDIAEQLEHIKSPLLISKLDEFLGFPKHDPHGDPIPDENGVFSTVKKEPLCNIEAGQSCKVITVNDSSSAFLKYLDKVGISIGTTLRIDDHNEFDGSVDITINQNKSTTVSPAAAQNILVTPL